VSIVHEFYPHLYATTSEAKASEAKAVLGRFLTLYNADTTPDEGSVLTTRSPLRVAA